MFWQPAKLRQWSTIFWRSGGGSVCVWPKSSRDDHIPYPRCSMYGIFAYIWHLWDQCRVSYSSPMDPMGTKMISKNEKWGISAAAKKNNQPGMSDIPKVNWSSTLYFYSAIYVRIYIYMCFFTYKVGFWGVSQCFHSHIGPTKSIHYRSGPIDLARFSPCLFNEDPGYLDIPKNKGGLWMLLFWCLRYWLFGISYSMAFHCEFGCTVMCKMKFLVDLIVNLQMTAW